MIKKFVSKHIDNKEKLAIKTSLRRKKKAIVDAVMKYDKEKLKKKLKQMGVGETDTLFVHANFKPDSGFAGGPDDIATALMELVGTGGNLMMISIPFRGTAYDYLKSGKQFKVNKTISMMGLVSEMFRRRESVLRSFHPTHPVLAYGKESAWLTEGHEKCLFPCGPGSPFEKFRQLNGKILFFDVSFNAITFFHYVEDLLKGRLPFNIYHENLFPVTAYDQEGREHIIKTYAFNRKYVRNAGKLEQEMEKRKMIKKGRVGNSSLLIVKAEDVVTCQTDMVESGNLPYDL